MASQQELMELQFLRSEGSIRRRDEHIEMVEAVCIAHGIDVPRFPTRLKRKRQEEQAEQAALVGGAVAPPPSGQCGVGLERATP